MVCNHILNEHYNDFHYNLWMNLTLSHLPNDNYLDLTQTYSIQPADSIKIITSSAINDQIPRKTASRKKKDNPVIQNLHALRYTKKDTVKQQKLNGKTVYIETDHPFVDSVEHIARMKDGLLQQIIKFSQSDLTEIQCEEMHYKGKTHAEANIINQNTSISGEDVANDPSLRTLQCTCGCERMRGKPYPVYTSPQQLSILGPGVILFFYFLKTIPIFLFTIILIYGIFALTTNIMGSTQEDYVSDGCSSHFCRGIIQISDYNKFNPVLTETIQNYLGLLSMLLWGIYMKLLYYFGKRNEALIDKYLTSASDYAIMISNLPTGTFNQLHMMSELVRLENKIRKEKKIELENSSKPGLLSSIAQTLYDTFLKGDKEERLLKPQDLQNEHLYCMKSVQVVYNMQFTRKTIENIMSLSLEIHKQIIKEHGKSIIMDKAAYLELKNRIIQTYQIILDIRKKFLNDPQFRKTLSTNICIIQFEEQEQKDILLSYYGGKKAAFFEKIKNSLIKMLTNDDSGAHFQGQVLTIVRAPEPTDILWQNCEKQQSLKRVFLIYMASFFITMGSFAIIAGLQYLQIKIINNSSQQMVEVSGSMINIIIGVVLQLINQLLWFSLTQMIQLEHNHTKTEAIISQMTKSSVMMLINIIILPIVVSYVFQQDFYGINGISGIVFNYHFSALFINLTLKLIAPFSSILRFCLNIKVIRNYIIKRKHRNIANKQGSDKIFLTKINKLYQYPEFDIAQSYVFIIANICQAAFFCELQPIILVFALFQCIYFYWICKFNLFRRNKIPEMTDFIIFKAAVTMFMILPIFYGAGSIFISYVTHRNSSDRPFQCGTSIGCIVIGILFFVDPKDVIKKIISKVATKCNSLNEDIRSSQRFKIFHNQSNQNSEKMEAERCQDYYHNSNTLSLLGFQKILKGNTNMKNIKAEYKQFCETFAKRKYKRIYGNFQEDIDLNREKSREKTYEVKVTETQNTHLFSSGKISPIQSNRTINISEKLLRSPPKKREQISSSVEIEMPFYQEEF